ncbi:MAG: aspartate aminotransferase family protein [Rubripirellula sp.]
MSHQNVFSAEMTSAISSVWGRLTKTPIVRGEGSWVYDIEGRSYLDFTSGIGVTATGHCHPKVVRAVQQQASQLLFGQMNCMLPEKTVEYSHAIRDVTPHSIDTFFFSNSGSEAVEGAIKLAKVSTGRPNVIAFQGGFHGRTAMTMALTSSKGIYREGYQPLPAGVFFSSFPNAFRDQCDPDLAVRNALADLELLLKTQTMPSETAAMLIEPVLGEGGYLPAPKAFLQGLREVCDRTGILLIVDDMWAHEASEVRPDILVMAKGIASGLPMSAIGASSDLMSKWQPGSHGGTYGGGSPLAMAAGLATLQVIQEEKLIENANREGEYLSNRLRDSLSRLPHRTDVRGPGLMVGVELIGEHGPDRELVTNLQHECLNRGLMLLTCGIGGNVIRWIPPVNVSRSEIDEAMDIFDLSLSSVMEKREAVALTP